MRFQTDHKPPPYLNRRDQYRLLAMVATLGLVMAAAMWAARPSSWYWLAPPTAGAGNASPIPALDEIDFRVQSSPHDPLGPDTFRAVAVPNDEDPPVPPDDRSNAPAAVEIPAELLAAIEDNTLGLRRKESDAYHWMLSQIDRLPESTAAAQARSDVAFTVLMLEPDQYRGRLLSVTGDLRRLTEFPASEESGFAALYEGWLFTRDSGTNPYRIVCTQRPEGIPLGESLDPPVPVRVNGFFFKRYGYASQQGQHVAPMLIAKSLHVRLLLPTAAADGPELQHAMLGVVSVVVAGIMTMGVWFFISDRRFRNSRLDQLAAARLDATPENLAALAQAETIDPQRLFAQDDAQPQK
ncbi:MAG: hypothetical protein AB7U20_13965 [Planctomycetaceae bacterium]